MVAKCPLVRRSLLFSDVRVENHSEVEDSVVLPGTRIGVGCRIRKAVIDSGTIIPDGTTIGFDPEEDIKRFRVTRDGVTVVVPEMFGQVPHYVR